MSTESRPYQMKVRAERQRETRDRIAKAAMELHGEVGPAKTTVAEIARRAGVQRLTVYNHFPDESALFPACSAHYLALHPFPDPAPAFALEDPGDRLLAVLESLYRWYRETEEMTGNIQRDRGSVPALEEFCARTIDVRFAQLADGLGDGFGARGARAVRVHGLIAVALDFWTWRRLDGEGLDDEAAARLMAGAVGAIAGR